MAVHTYARLRAHRQAHVCRTVRQGTGPVGDEKLGTEEGGTGAVGEERLPLLSLKSFRSV